MNFKIIAAWIVTLTALTVLTAGCAGQSPKESSTLAPRTAGTAEPAAETAATTTATEPEIQYFPFGGEQLPLDTENAKLDGVLFAQTHGAENNSPVNLMLVGFGVYTTAEHVEYAYVDRLILQNRAADSSDNVQLDFGGDIIVASDMSNLEYDVVADKNTDEPVITVRYRPPFDDTAVFKEHVYVLSKGAFAASD